jgi:hypothetical protein
MRIYEGAKTTVRNGKGDTAAFDIAYANRFGLTMIFWPINVTFSEFLPP